MSGVPCVEFKNYQLLTHGTASIGMLQCALVNENDLERLRGYVNEIVAENAKLRELIATPVLSMPASGETVRVRAAVWRDIDGELIVKGYGDNIADELVLDEGAESWEHLAWIQADIPLPIVPTLPATVAPAGGE